jgi:hypothetical protein
LRQIYCTKILKVPGEIMGMSCVHQSIDCPDDTGTRAPAMPCRPACLPLRDGGSSVDASPGTFMHETITAEHLHLCMVKGTKIEVGHTMRYYYKGLCVVTNLPLPSNIEHVVTAFWTPQDHQMREKYNVMLKSIGRSSVKKRSFKKASGSLLMLREADHKS